jgi:hypothetical protein
MHGLRELAVVEPEVAQDGLLEVLAGAESVALQNVVDPAVEPLDQPFVCGRTGGARRCSMPSSAQRPASRSTCRHQTRRLSGEQPGFGAIALQARSALSDSPPDCLICCADLLELAGVVAAVLSELRRDANPVNRLDRHRRPPPCFAIGDATTHAFWRKAAPLVWPAALGLGAPLTRAGQKCRLHRRRRRQAEPMVIVASS